MAEPTLKEKVKSRQEHVRQWMFNDRLENPLFHDITSVAAIGEYIDKRWDSFGRIALHDDGSLLGTDSQWNAIEKEMDDWPSTVWASQLDNDLTLRQASDIFNKSKSGFALSVMAKPMLLVEPTWAPAEIKSVSQLDIWKWLGPVGGTMPEATTT